MGMGEMVEAAALGIRKDKREFITWLETNCPHFALVQELANSTKHCRPVHSTDHIQVYGRGPYGHRYRALSAKSSSGAMSAMVRNQ